MALFNLGKKNEEKKPCCCQSNAEKSGSGCQGSGEAVRSIKVLGAGCPACHTQYENVKEAVKNLSLKVEVEYITDMQKVTEYGVMSMPAIVVNEKVLTQGKVLKASYIEKLLDK